MAILIEEDEEDDDDESCREESLRIIDRFTNKHLMKYINFYFFFSILL